MSMKFVIKDGYLGECGEVRDQRSCSNDATHHELMVFEEPVPVPEALIGLMEPMTGIWSPVCDTHCDPTREHKKVCEWCEVSHDITAHFDRNNTSYQVVKDGWP
jgi:hypothetical protein